MCLSIDVSIVASILMSIMATVFDNCANRKNRCSSAAKLGLFLLKYAVRSRMAPNVGLTQESNTHRFHIEMQTAIYYIVNKTD